MKNYNLGILLLLISLTMKAQLSGTASLQGQTNHSGIRVKFLSQGGTAVTDSAYTTASGSYSINITPGVYSVAFAKPGYVDVFLNNGASVLLTNTTVLSGVTLGPGNPVFVNGNVGGNWTGSNVYVVMGNLTIPSGTTLTIMPGARVQFNGYYSISGGGVIKALGTSGSPILFTSGLQSVSRNDWNVIGLNSTGSLFDNCIIEYSFSGLNFQSGGANVTNSVIRHCGVTAVYMAAGTPLIENNEVYDLDNASSVVGIWVEGSASGTVSCNYIHNLNSSTSSSSYGIIHNSSLVKDNHIANITGYSPIGIQTRYAGSKNIGNCITNSGAAIDVDGSWTNTNPLIANNTLYANQMAIRINCSTHATNPTIVNNLITDNAYGIAEYGATSGTITVDHNLLWNQSFADYQNVQTVGLGTIVSTNSSGYPIDSYYNMYQDPLYNIAPPLLTSSSPCYGTGNAVYSAQIGFSNPTGCVATVASVPNEEMGIKLNVSPNPSAGIFTISSDTREEIAVTISDLSGRVLQSCVIMSGQQINASELSNGMYILNLRKGKVAGRTRLVISK